MRREEREVREKAHAELEYVGIKARWHDHLANNLAYGDQRRVEIARALASDPKVLLLDEPTAGMNPQETAALTDFMRRLRDERGMTILLIEHDMKVVMGVSERVTVLDHGEKIAEGLPAEVRAEPARSSRRTSARPPLKRRRTDGASRSRRHPDLLRQHPGAQGRLADRRRGRERDADRLQRRRQVDDAALDLGAHAARTGSIKLAGKEISMLPPQEIVALGICQSPEGRKCFQRMTVRENLELGAYLRRDSQGIETDLDAGLRAVPAAGRAPVAEGRHDVRRRAADARDRPRADGQAEGAAARRAVDGHLAGAHRAIYETIAEINPQG